MRDLRREYSGFVQSVGITCILVFIAIWMLIPYPPHPVKTANNIRQNVSLLISEVLDILPQRYWIICIQCMILMQMLFAYIGLPIFNDDVLNVPLYDLKTITDSKAILVEFQDHEEFLRKYAFEETSGVYDIPITEVSKVLYGSSKLKKE
ncbi:phosphatidylinositol N-acetylglucosaminyltransferase GPI19 Ecym_4084 [Eremothecium cymbalariae DBVPG|uniref:Phosphatidylinositol N-acetylglucosaminyltransferase subunit GPI19 n=1 Tax=Eremothecium cymbalariae (strain CBS 270.75 / DBVPG 7215 / KCTC 17166 / NRRL Y-17582) TaxID=931890 RepID=G8JT10_ERECY|nr:hypothetical protein Ecym_4084 [Eremothecium cymbalariae DBVPG\